MNVNAIKCKKCKTIIWSRHAFDKHWCPCKTVAVDGGTGCLRITGNKDEYEILDISVDCTWTDAFHDWNNNTNKFGTIKEKKKKKNTKKKGS
jgi:hypothetical protein